MLKPMGEDRISRPSPRVPTGAESEIHYTVADIAGRWNLSKDTVRRLFREEEGVLLIPSRNPRRPLRANYNTMLIPESVAKRVHAKYSFGKRWQDSYL
jgi:AraC-like DNA-binding protein